MKEMYLKVKVEDIKDIDFVDVFYRKGRYFICPKDSEELVEIEDAEEKGAEKLAESISYIIEELVNGKFQKVGEAFGGRTEVSAILQNFSPKVINYRVEKMKQHVPTMGDIYASRKSGNEVVVLSYNKETRRVRFMGGSYVTNGSVEDFDKMFSFTGRNYQGIDSIVNELYSGEGDNT